MDNDSTVLGLLSRWWAAPNSVIGHALGWRCERRRCGDGITEYLNNRLLNRLRIAAIVFGNTVNYGTSVDPEKIVPRYDREGYVSLRQHELEHVRQYRLLGPFFIPLYLIGETLRPFYKGINPFEIATDNRCTPMPPPKRK